MTQFYSQAALVLNDFSGVLLQAQQLLTTAHTIGTISDANYASAQQTFKMIATNGDTLTSLVKAGGDQTTITTEINALIGQVGAMPASFGIKDATTAAEFTSLATAMQSILKAVVVLVQPSVTVPA